jgi:hypothetical protein
MNSVDPSGLAVGCVHMLFDDASCSDGGFFGYGPSMTCIMDGVDTRCGQVSRFLDLGIAVQCPNNDCSPRTGNNGSFYPIVYTEDGFAYKNPSNGDTFSSASELGLPSLDDPLGLFPYSGGGNQSASSGGGGGSNQSCVVSRVTHTQAISGAQYSGPGIALNGHQQTLFTLSQASFQSLGPAFSPFGINNGYRFGGVFFSLHANNFTTLPTGGMQFEAHFDVLNPATGLFGIVGHTIVDGGIGRLLFHRSNGLDRACR